MVYLDVLVNVLSGLSTGWTIFLPRLCYYMLLGFAIGFQMPEIRISIHINLQAVAFRTNRIKFFDGWHFSMVIIESLILIFINNIKSIDPRVRFIF